MKYRFTVNDKKNVYDGFVKLDRYNVSYEKFSGGYVNEVYRECGIKNDVTAIIAYDPKRRECVLVEQFRVGMAVRGNHPWVLEVVAGFIDKEGETAIDTAKRELIEETGCHAKKMHTLFNYYPNPGGSAMKVHLFVAEVDSSEAKLHTGVEEEGEDILVHRVSIDEIAHKIENKELNNAISIIAFQMFLSQGWADKL